MCYFEVIHCCFFVPTWFPESSDEYSLPVVVGLFSSSSIISMSFGLMFMSV